MLRTGAGPRHPEWKDVPLAEWEDWRWQMHNAVRTTQRLAELLPIPAQGLATLAELETQYKLAIPPYYLSLINPEDPYDPIGLQALPNLAETLGNSGVELEDPLEEDKDSPVPGLTHRYPDRVLLVTTPVCSMYCRFCTRKRVTMDRDGWDAPSHDDRRMVDYVRNHPEIHDCIISGGDALMLSEGKLRWFLTELAAIEHVGVIRLGTRVPVTLPQKLFDTRLIELLQSVDKVWIQTHFNHPTEITPEAARGCRNLVNAGMPISNHSVLLKGVNDSVQTMRDLVRGLLRIKVRPYYLFHCDPVVGAGHFRTTVWKGMEIIEGLRGHVSGLAVPTYVVDGLHGAGKIPLLPNYLVSASENAVVLRNYEGMLFRYSPEDREATEPSPLTTTGVSNLLSGQGSKLLPEGTARIERRKSYAQNVEPTDVTAAATGAPASTADDARPKAPAKSKRAVAAKAPPADRKVLPDQVVQSVVVKGKLSELAAAAGRSGRPKTRLDSVSTPTPHLPLESENHPVPAAGKSAARRGGSRRAAVPAPAVVAGASTDQATPAASVPVGSELLTVLAQRNR
ncbi:MAG: KamA family radical SAM protein [Planctomycetaceae bacterium]|nr:KamA family radical SAM protein [Planctomycetaceae bacterium]